MQIVDYTLLLGRPTRSLDSAIPLRSSLLGGGAASMRACNCAVLCTATSDVTRLHTAGLLSSWSSGGPILSTAERAPATNPADSAG